VPTEPLVVAGATVTVVDGPDAGRTATTDATGAFTFAALSPGGFTVRASGSGYASLDVGVDLRANLSVALRMRPLSRPAGTIDLRGLPGFDFSTWGPRPSSSGGASLIGQSVIATGSVFSEFRFSAVAFGDERCATTDLILFNILITGDRVGGGLGFKPDFADIRYTSEDLSVGGDMLTETTVNPGITVAPGERLFVVLNTFSFPASGCGFVRGVRGSGVEQYAAGEHSNSDDSRT
jgi:hypothetical protein